jgi:transcriptional regulator with XRE-family HTH domain
MAMLAAQPGEAIEQLERDLGLSAADLALALGIERATLDLWRAGAVAPPQGVQALLAAWLRLHDDLLDLFGSAQPVREWMRIPLRFLDRRTPLALAREGRLDRLRAAFEALASGIFL